ncbi:MAG: response regulator [Balneolales bacterium]|nr:response regulator [Balneolales bacterium]
MKFDSSLLTKVPALYKMLSDVSNIKLSHEEFAIRLQQILEHIGSHIEASALTIYIVDYNEDAAKTVAPEDKVTGTEETANYYFSQLVSWKAGNEGRKNKDAQMIPVNPYYERWFAEFKENKCVYGQIDTFPDVEQELLHALHIKSTCMLPYLKEGKLAGYIAIDNCVHIATIAKSFMEKPGESMLGWIFPIINNRYEIEESEKQKALLQTQLQNKNQILANLSHEIRTPMNGIVGLAEQLEDLEDDLSKKSFLESIKLSAANLMEVLTGIAEFSTSEHDPDYLTKDIIHPDEDIIPILNAYHEKATEKGLKYTYQISEQLPAVFISDYQKIRNIIKNLLDNAIKFTNEGEVKAKIYWKEESSLLCFSVQDTGIGISKDKQDYVFEKYAQIEQGFTRSYSGIGLGLSIVKNTVSLLNGTLELESELGHGSCFEVTLPVDVADDSKFSNTTITHELLQNLRFLVVDDHPINRKVVTTILKKWGSSYDVAKNGLEAVEKMQQEEFDIVLMDIQMPVMDGYEATRKIRHLLGDKVTILALTASILKEDEMQCLKSGMDGIIRKPFFPDNLKYWVQQKKNGTTLKTDFIVSSDMEVAPARHTNNASENSEIIMVTDLAYLREISDGNKEFMDEMINLFIDQSVDHMDSLNEGVDNQNFDAIAKAAHKMKPVLGYVGIDPEASHIKEIESLAKSESDINLIKQHIIKLFEIINKANEELARYLKEQ